MKKKGLMALLLALVCLLSVACGKEDKESKKEEKATVKTLECSLKEDDAEVTMVIKQDQKTYKFTELTMTMSGPKKAYEDLKVSDADLEKMICEDEDEQYKSCKVKFEGDKLIATMEFDPDKYEKEVIDDEDYDIEKLDENTLKKLKDSAEDDKYTCKLS